MVSIKNVWAIARNTIIAVLGSSVIAIPVAFSDDDYRSYVGVGAQLLKLDLKKEYGQPLFKRTVPGASIFAGVRFGQYFGAELGYNYFSKKRNARLNADDIFPGSGQTLKSYNGADWIEYKTKFSMKDINLGATGYLPLENLSCILDKTELFATIGLSRTTVRADLEAVADDQGAIPTGTAVATFKKTKTVPFARFGVQQNILENINLSLFTEWKRLGGVKLTSTGAMELRLKNSMSYGIRAGYTF